MNVVIVLKWVWRERVIVNAAHSGRMLATDTARFGTKTRQRGILAVSVGGIDRYLFFHGQRVSANNARDV